MRDLLGEEDRVVLRGEQDARAQADARGHGGSGGQRDERVETALVVVEADALDERGWQVLSQREVRVLGEPERVEAELLDRDGERGRRQVAVGERGGDAEPHGQAGAAFAAKSARVPRCAAPESTLANAPCSRRLASRTASRRAARMSEVMARVGGPGNAAIRAASVTVSSRTVPVSHTLQGQPEVHELLGTRPSPT